MSALQTITPLRQLTLDDLWAEAAAIGNLRVYPRTEGWGCQGRLKGYEVTLYCRSGRTDMEIKCEGSTLALAICDAINEARRVGAGEPAWPPPAALEDSQRLRNGRDASRQNSSASWANALLCELNTFLRTTRSSIWLSARTFEP